MNANIKWVVVEHHVYSGRYTALRNLSFKTQEEAQQHIDAIPNPRYRQKLSVESRQEKVEAEGERMTCQCCGGSYLAKLGTIAHHGYQRPGTGWQTASCMGAKFVPFENGHARLDQLIATLEGRMKDLKKAVKETQEEKVEVRFTFPDYSQPRSRTFGQPTKTVSFTRQTFDQVKKENAEGWRRMASGHSFEECQQRQIAKYESQYTATKTFHREATKRRVDWKHTHDYDKKQKVWQAR